MVELLQLTEAVLVATAVTIGVVVTPAAIITGDSPPDLSPLLEKIDDNISDEDEDVKS